MSIDSDATDRSHPLDLFFGGVPPYMMFKMDLDEVTEIVESYQEHVCDGEVLQNKAAELGVIGAVAYFESFCKHHFAALVHCCPPLLERFADRRPQMSITIRDLAHVGCHYVDSIGYVVAERYDFGSGNQINGLFTDLLDVTPLPRDDVARFDDLLNDRHLLVHHSGIYTLQYAREKGLLASANGGPFRDSLVVTNGYYQNACKFLDTSAKKVTHVTYHALDVLLKENAHVMAQSRPDALEYLLSDFEAKRPSGGRGAG